MTTEQEQSRVVRFLGPLADEIAIPWPFADLPDTNDLIAGPTGRYFVVLSRTWYPSDNEVAVFVR